jgi:RNA polymerase sigma-70 factor, ECF subfamily
MWRRLGQLKDPDAFAGWLKRSAINTWLQHQRRNDALHGSAPAGEEDRARHSTGSLALDIDHALEQLPGTVRLCIVLSYHAQMSHSEIAEATALPLGTVKSHIRLGTLRLRSLLSEYAGPGTEGVRS